MLQAPVYPAGVGKHAIDNASEVCCSSLPHLSAVHVESEVWLPTCHRGRAGGITGPNHLPGSGNYLPGQERPVCVSTAHYQLCTEWGRALERRDECLLERILAFVKGSYPLLLSEGLQGRFGRLSSETFPTL